MSTDDDHREPTQPAHRRADRADRRGVPGDPRRGVRRPRRARRDVHPQHHPVPPAARGLCADPADGLPLHAGLGARAQQRLWRGQDHREHGDRPQRDARPVGLDERSLHPLLDLGLGHRIARVGVEALPQLRPPHLHERDRQGQGRRLRDSARRPKPAVAPALPPPALLQHPPDALFFEWGVAFHDLDFEAIKKGTKPKEQVQDELRAIGTQGPAPDRQGLHRVPGRSPAATGSGR